MPMARAVSTSEYRWALAVATAVVRLNNQFRLSITKGGMAFSTRLVSSWNCGCSKYGRSLLHWPNVENGFTQCTLRQDAFRHAIEPCLELETTSLNSQRH